VGRDALDAVIRTAAPGDLGAVADIFAWYVRNTVATFEETPRTLRDWAALAVSLRSADLPFLVAEAGGRIAGYAYAGPWRVKPAYRRTVEDSVYVANGHTGHGLGRLLLGGLLAACAQSGVRQVIAVIADTGEPAPAALHESFGFTAAGRLTAVGYKHGRWIDTLLMQHHLPGLAGQGSAG
jgi:phosphinothricin acetyltransferase